MLTREHADARRESDEVQWSALLEAGLRCLGKTEAEARNERKSTEWKLAVGAWLKSQTEVSNRWLADRFHMGHPQAASRQMIISS